MVVRSEADPDVDVIDYFYIHEKELFMWRVRVRMNHCMSECESD